MTSKDLKDVQGEAPRQPWQKPAVRPAGTLADVLKGGTNKVTAVTGDPMEPQKIPGMDK